MANPQAENGYTRLANEILEIMAKVKLSPTQYRLLFVVWRFTYGFNRKSHNFSLGFLANATGCDKRSIQRDLTKLEEKKVILQEVKNGVGRVIEFNKNYDDWFESIGETTNGQIANGQIANGETTNTSVGETTNGTIGEIANQERNKENYKENTTTTDCFNFYEQNFGLLTFHISQKIGAWLEDFNDQDEILIYAMQIALERNKRNFGYAESILKDWYSKNAKSLKDCEALQNEFLRVNVKPHKKQNNIDWENV
jgi:phage replication O-like protein O